MKPTVYLIVSPTGAVYVGATNNFAERRRTHRRRLQKGAGVNAKLQASWDVHGPHEFVVYASALRAEWLHEVEAAVLAQFPDNLNVRPPTPLPSATTQSGRSRAFGGFPSVAEYARAHNIPYRRAKYLSSPNYAIRLLCNEADVLLRKKRPYVPLPKGMCKFIRLVNRSKDLHQTFRYQAPERPPMVNARYISHNGRTNTVAGWCKITGVKSSLAYARLSDGWTPQEAVGLVPRERPAPQRKSAVLDSMARMLAG